MINVDIPAPVEVSADPDRVLQAVSSLVTNVLTHTPASAALSLGAETDGEAVIIRVADRGPGIPDDHLGRGRAIAKSLVEAHSG